MQPKIPSRKCSPDFPSGAQHAKILGMLYAIDVEGLFGLVAWWLGVCSFKAKYLHNPSVGFIRNFLLLIVGESRKHMK
uniref:Uncharacterized protein n=1 Tax=Cucumis sativus TaxID=3659 RepID=A0A0A0K596_CUCSA